MKTKLLASLAFNMLLVAGAHAQPFTVDWFTVDWFTVDGGGGASAGGGFTIAGTTGQPDTGAASGANFSISGGFWSLISGSPAPPVSLNIRRMGGSVVLAWPVSASGFTLEYTTLLDSGAWFTEPAEVVDTATEHTVTVPANVGYRYYRLKH